MTDDHYVNMFMPVIYYKKFDSDCQSHSNDSINLKGLSVLKTSLFCLFFVRFSSALLVSNLYIYIDKYILQVCMNLKNQGSLAALM